MRPDNKLYTKWEWEGNRRACLKRRRIRKLMREGKKDAIKRLKEAIYAHH